MVVCAKEEAAQIGLAILQKGGNAFDAMVATELALAVSYPNAGNIGGGGFMVYRLADGEKGALDYREKAPAKAHRDMYLDKDGKVIADKSTLGALAIGVPGTIDGLFAVHERFGKLPMAELIQPAIDLARNGVVITPLQADFYMNKNVELITTLRRLRMVGRRASVLNMRSWRRLWNALEITVGLSFTRVKRRNE